MDWQLLGKDGSSRAIIGSKFFELATSARPINVGARGSYSASYYTGVLPAALAANSEIFQFRHTQVGSIVVLLRNVRVSAALSTTAFIAGVPATLEMKIARAWTGQGTGGTGITFGTNDAKKRTSFATTVLAANDVRIATTAALGGGTKTLDGTPAATISWQPGTATNAYLPPTTLWQRDTNEEYPHVFGNQEGFVIRSVEVPATGTWKFAISMEWSEIDAAVFAEWA